MRFPGVVALLQPWANFLYAFSVFESVSEFGVLAVQNLCFICHQVVKARINKGFLGAMDGHCQWKCQQGGGWNHHSPAFAGLRRNFAHNTLTVCDVTGA